MENVAKFRLSLVGQVTQGRKPDFDVYILDEFGKAQLYLSKNAEIEAWQRLVEMQHERIEPGRLVIMESDREDYLNWATSCFRDNLQESYLSGVDVFKKVAVEWTGDALQSIADVENGLDEATYRMMTVLVEKLFDITESMSLVELQEMDYSTAVHSVNSAVLIMNCLKTARDQGNQILSQIDIQEAGLTALLHDIGKVIIEKRRQNYGQGPLFSLPRKLTEREYEEVKKHPDVGWTVLSRSAVFGRNTVLAGVQQHHERGSGNGYPKGLTFNQISPIGRLMAIVDVYEAITNDERPYRRKMTHEEAIEIISRDAKNGSFDEDMLWVFIESIGKK